MLSPEIQKINIKRYEIIVTDDSNNSISKELVSEDFAWIKWIEGPKRGPAANRNNGVKCAKGEWLIFIDDDCLPDRNLLNKYAEVIKSYPDCLAFEGAIFPENPELLRIDMAECPVNTEGGCFWSANICVNTVLFNKAGGFDERFLIAAQEDQELYQRLLQFTNVVFCKDCSVIHPIRYRGLKEKIKLIPVEIKNWIQFAKIKHSWSRVFFYGAISQIKACVRSLQQNKFRMVIYHFLSLLYLLPAIIYVAIQNNGKQKI